ncbi:glycosyltransferase [Tabrizicola sp. WMC-M-20]|nr:glycosyltransferase [Tabrizicola sp. WMC-M-20]
MTAGLRPRVLLLAEAANPDWVSVPLVGWSLARALARVADVHLVTQVRNRDAILRAGLVEGVDFTAIDSEALARPLWKLGTFLTGGRGGWTIQQAVATISYPYFEHLVWQRFGKEICAGRYDVVHRITPLSPVQQSPIAAKCRRAGVPFVLGPINGGVPWPKGFQAEMAREREWLSQVRGLYRALPGRQGTLRADAILAGSRQTLREIPAAHHGRVIYLPENAVDPARFNTLARHNGPGPMRACFIGRLVPLKGVDMLISAAAPLLRSGRLALDIIGDGDQMPALRAQAAEFGAAVVFHGWQNHAQVQYIAARCQLLAFPSIREFGGGVVLEAMALGLAPIVVDYAGPAELVTDATGWKVPITGRAGVIAGLATRLAHCVDHPHEVAQKGQAALARVQALFTWDRKAAQILDIYRWVMTPDRPKPAPFGPG